MVERGLSNTTVYWELLKKNTEGLEGYQDSEELWDQDQGEKESPELSLAFGVTYSLKISGGSEKSIRVARQHFITGREAKVRRQKVESEAAKNGDEYWSNSGFGIGTMKG